MQPGEQKKPVTWALRYPIALLVGFGCGLLSHEVLGLTRPAAWTVSAAMFIACLTLLHRVIYSRIG